MSLRVYDYRCTGCGEYFLDQIVEYDDRERLECSGCHSQLEIIWRQFGAMHSDGNLTREEKAAIAIHLGFQGEGENGYMVIPETRSDLRRFKEIHGDIPVTEKEILSERPRTKYKPPPKAETIEEIRKLRAMRRSGNLPRRAVDEELLKAVKIQHEGAEIV